MKMLDTIILTINRGGYSIINHDKFMPSTRNMLFNTAGYAKYINNPTKEDKDKGVYKPRLTIFKRGKNFPLKIEFSVPKLMYGNNLEEVEPRDFDNIIKILQKKLLDMGVSVWTKHLEEASVIALHPSKNIKLSDGYTASFAIRELYKIDLSLKYDITKINYRNNGEAIQIYANNNSITFYDKINDLNKPAKRAIDREQTATQKTIFDYIKTKQNTLEVLRYETRLSHKKKLNEILVKLGHEPDPTFKQIFSNEICQSILLYYWNYHFAGQKYIFSIDNSPQKLFQLLLHNYPNFKS